MQLYQKQKSRVSNLSRVYNFDNARNGGLGPGFFLGNLRVANTIKDIIKEKMFDLSIHIVLNKVSETDLATLINNNLSNINIQKYLVDSNLSNINSIKKNIDNDSSRKFFIIDSSLVQYFSYLRIPYFIYDRTNVDINNEIINALKLTLFYKIEQNIRI